MYLNPLFLKLGYFFIFELQEFFIYFEYKSFIKGFENIFSHSMDCLFTFFIVSFEVKGFNFEEVQFRRSPIGIIFILLLVFLVSYLEIIA